MLGLNYSSCSKVLMEMLTELSGSSEEAFDKNFMLRLAMHSIRQISIEAVFSSQCFCELRVASRFCN